LYLGTAVIESTFAQYSNLTQISSAVEDIAPLIEAGNNVATALALANHAFTGKVVRTGSTQLVVVVFLDSPSDDPAATYNQATLLKNSNITIITVSLTSNVDKDELSRVSTKSRYVISALNYGASGDPANNDIIFLCSIGNTGIR